jgi:Kef-type K+ transport system membrane component KefB
MILLRIFFRFSCFCELLTLSMHSFIFKRWLWTAFVLFAAPTPAWCSEGASDPVAPVLLALSVVLVAAKLGGEVAVRLKQPAVVGELLAGVILSNVSWLRAEWIAQSTFLDLAARVGVVLLLFEIGLESTVSQMLKVGRSAFAVAVIGVVVPSALGAVASAWLFREQPLVTHLFLGATLSATSVGLSARVLKDFGVGDSSAARIILGAAVLDDVLGLLLLAVVSGSIASANAGVAFEASQLLFVGAKAAGFLLGALVLGRWVAPRLFQLASRLHARAVLLPSALVACFSLSYLADRVGLAPIVGAFAAGLILDEVSYRDLEQREQQTLERLVHPLTQFLLPIFFVLIGMRVEIRTLFDSSVAVMIVVLTAVALFGKVIAGFGVREPDVDKWLVGFGMIPRGEVGLIFATIGSTLRLGGVPVVSASIYTAIVATVIATTIIGPVLLGARIRRISNH